MPRGGLPALWRRASQRDLPAQAARSGGGSSRRRSALQLVLIEHTTRRLERRLEDWDAALTAMRRAMFAEGAADRRAILAAMDTLRCYLSRLAERQEHLEAQAS